VWDRFSKRLKRAIKHASELAQELGTAYIEPEHLLIGLLQGSESTAYRMISRLGVAPEKIVRHAGMELPRSSTTPTNMAFSDAAKSLLEQSFVHARRLSHDHIGTGHMLLAIACARGTSLSQMLRGFEIEYEQLREVLTQQLWVGGSATQPLALQVALHPRLTRAIALAKCAEITTLMSHIEFADFETDESWIHRCKLMLRELLAFMPEGPQELFAELQLASPVDLRSLEQLIGEDKVLGLENLLWQLAKETIPAWAIILEADFRRMTPG